MRYVLGIDGGGTKTTGLIADETGKAIAEATVGASNPNIVSTTELVNTFSKLKAKLEMKNQEAFSKVDRLYAGISGTGHPSAQKKIHDVLSNVMTAGVSITIDNDAIIALYSGTLGKPGIVQISGTGSITYGINHEGKRDRVGGWGHFIGEKGGGYGLGSDALQAVFAAHDQLGPPTLLEKTVPSFFDEQTPPDLIPLIYQASSPKETIASLGRLVMEAADQNDDVATDILYRNGYNIGQYIKTLAAKLFQNDTFIPVVLAGGLFNRIDLFQQAIEDGTEDYLSSIQLIKPEEPPVHGAVMAALMMD